ncbi:hypothetical protein [Moraxella catarrhalis]|uniref:Uncharacterized protein n=1 Tax=Moraxella catarrhalis TaxID=480 RepID=A0A3Q9GBC2_MORCA|nr:hypothetical protein [Moraxella catarrhalis]AZQ93220.1 hypothetical protein EJK53_2113 [Moraxella catarrhalis]
MFTVFLNCLKASSVKRQASSVKRQASSVNDYLHMTQPANPLTL